MRVIGGLRFNVALAASRFRTTDRGYARRLRRGGWRESCGRCLRLCAGMAACACAPGMARFTFALVTALVSIPRARLAFAAIAAPRGSRLAFTSRLAAAARTFPGTLA